jgi:hypothetical protein
VSPADCKEIDKQEIDTETIEKYRGETLLFSDSNKRSIVISMSWGIGTMVYTESKVLKVFSLYFSLLNPC